MSRIPKIKTKAIYESTLRRKQLLAQALEEKQIEYAALETAIKNYENTLQGHNTSGSLLGLLQNQMAVHELTATQMADYMDLNKGTLSSLLSSRYPISPKIETRLRQKLAAPPFSLTI
jgi:hypothetical protein